MPNIVLSDVDVLDQPEWRYLAEHHGYSFKIPEKPRPRIKAHALE